MKELSGNKYHTLLFLIIALHFLLFFLTGLFRHWGNLTSINDLGVFDQAVWGMINAESFLNTILLNEKINWIAVHFHPVLLIFIPFYLLISSPIWFILTQALALSLTAWPIYILGRRIFNSEKTAMLWAVIYLVNPFVLNAAAWDFHPITLAVPFVALGMLAVKSKNFKLMFFSILVILLCKEHLGIMAVGFGILWWIRNRQWKLGMVLILIGIIHFYVVLKIIMPAISPTGQHVMVSEGLGQLSRYAWLGQSIGDIIRTALSQPLYVLKTVLIHMGGAFYLFLLLLPFLGFSLLGLPFLFPAAADLATNLLSANPMPRSPIAYHSVTLIPILTVAAIYGIKNAVRRMNKFSLIGLSTLVLFTSGFLGYLLAPFPLPGAENVWAPGSFVNWHDRRIKEVRLLVGQDASISVQANIGAHFSQRKEVYRFPNRLDHVNAVVLWLDTPTENVRSYSEEQKKKRQYVIGMLDNHLQMDRDDFLHSVETLLEDNRFGVIYWNDPWLVFKKGLNNQHNVSGIREKLEKLRREW